MELTKKRWLVLGLCCLINLCIGSIYAWSVFAQPMAAHLSQVLGRELTSGDLAIVYTIANAVGPITMISGGFFNDKFGPKAVIFLGGLMFGVGMILSGFASSVGMLICTYGLLGGLGLGMAYGCTISTGVKFFPDKRGLVGGITTAVYGLSSVILPPIANALVDSVGVQRTFNIVGLVFLIVICVCALFLFPCPDGFVPEGYVPPKATAKSAPVRDKNWQEMLKSPVFYVMMACMLCGAFSGMMIISQASAVAQVMVGLSASTAAVAVSVLALFNAFGRIAAGTLSDKIGRINTLTVALVLSFFGLLVLRFSGEGKAALFYLGIAVVGISFGSFMGVYPGFTADRFGAKNNSVNYGIMFIGFALAGYFGPTIMKNAYASTGQYQTAFLYAMVFAVVGLCLTFAYRALVKKEG